MATFALIRFNVLVEISRLVFLWLGVYFVCLVNYMLLPYYNIGRCVILIGILIILIRIRGKSPISIFVCSTFVLILLHYRRYVSYTSQQFHIRTTDQTTATQLRIFYTKDKKSNYAISIIYAMMERVFEQLQFGMSISFHFIARYLIFHNRIYSKSIENL